VNIKKRNNKAGRETLRKGRERVPEDQKWAGREGNCADKNSEERITTRREGKLSVEKEGGMQMFFSLMDNERG